MFPPTDPLYPYFSILSFFSFLLPLIPLTWHLQAWNSASCFYMAWTSIMGLINFVNSIVWAGNVLDVAPVWCDISTRISLAGTYALPLGSMCIVRRLYLIASAKTALTRIERRRALIFDTIVCLIVPLVLSALRYIVQGRRYIIYQEIGCIDYTYRSAAALILINLPPIASGLVSAYYDVRCLTALFRHYQELKDSFDSANADEEFTSDRFIPIVLFTVLEMISVTPIAISALAFNFSMGLQPWISWEHVHASFAIIPVSPSDVWRSSPLRASSLEMRRWVTSGCGVVIFLFFGTTKEARKHYSVAFFRLRCLLGRDVPTSTSNER
ncbi:fungal pheromone STE3G-protein-coupled receptor [Gymnopus androsaceus JB14]|uniref:Fungal pheromone STE3G-protein-coupled receptor n=1 Tax=Gymnopus androsaceus JB14 TaxID=1447944 RepID=A0A6A4HAI6_9AGAR|nr:fungal pheromone STE3G-protein-coupled receptor [Gymnopus androsaceus JB14]